MSVLYMVLPLALIIATVAVWAFVWSVKRGQFDDLETPAMRILHDDTEARRPKPSDERKSPNS